MENEMKVNVSGKAVYVAVKNYIQNSPEFQEQIRAHIARILDEKAEQYVQKALTGLEAEIKSEVRVTIRQSVRQAIEKSVTEKIATAFIAP